MSHIDDIKDDLFENVVNADDRRVVDLTNEGLQAGLTASEMLWEALIPALEEVGRLFEIGEIFVPEMLLSARAMQRALDILKPLLAEEGVGTVGTFVMGTVQGDMHDIGKNLCNIMLEGSGFKIVDLGVNVPPAKFVEAIHEHNPDAIGMSAFLTTTMPMFKKNIETMIQAGVRDQVKVLVGGAPVTAEYARVIGADGYARDASKVVTLTKHLVGIRSIGNLPEDADDATIWWDASVP